MLYSVLAVGDVVGEAGLAIWNAICGPCKS